MTALAAFNGLVMGALVGFAVWWIVFWGLGKLFNIPDDGGLEPNKDEKPFSLWTRLGLAYLCAIFFAFSACNSEYEQTMREIENPDYYNR